MSTSQDDILKLVGMAYDASLDERQWTPFLEAFVSATGGESAILRSVCLRTNSAGFVSSIGYDPAWQKSYCDHFVKLDYPTHSLKALPAGEVRSNDQVICRSDERKTEFYNDYMVPQCKENAMGSLLINENGNTLLFAAQRGKRAGAWGETERRLTSALVPHLTRAVQIQRKIYSVTSTKEHAQAALDQFRMGVILVNRSGAPLYLNRAAELMMKRDAGLSVFHNRLAVHSPSETAQLHKLISNAAQSNDHPSIGGEMRISIPFCTDYLFCMVTPISAEMSHRLNLSLGSDCVALFITKSAGLQLSAKRLVSLYKISPAEARLSARLAALRTLEEAADDLGISIFTARTQLKSVFAKTGTRSQSELLMLLATGPLAQCRDN